MRVARATLYLLLLAYLAACAPSLEPREGAAAPEQPASVAPAPAAPETPAATAPPSPKAEFAPGIALLAGAPPFVRTDVRKLVEVPPGVELRQGAGEWFARHEGTFGPMLPFGVLWDGWLGLRLERGLGWIPSSGRHSMVDQDGDGARYLLEPGLSWTLESRDNLRVQVTRPSPGVFTVDVLGAPEPAAVAAYPQTNALHLAFGAFKPARARLDINEDRFLFLSANGGGLLLEFGDLPGVRLLANEPGKISLEVRPEMDSLSMRTEGESTVLTASTRGYAPPAVEREGAGLTLRLQGARLPESSGAQMPQGLQVREEPEGVSISLQTDRPHRVRLTPTGLELVLHTPGLAQKRIVIDPGHGGAETGTSTPWGLAEKDLNLSLSHILARQLEAAGVQVLLLRHGDSGAEIPDELRMQLPPASGTRWELSTRALISNWWDADLLLSVHHNGGPDPAASGTEVYWHPTNLNADRSHELGRLTQRELVQELGTYDRGVLRRPLGMVRLPHAPAVLLEIGFLTNPSEARFLASQEAQERSAAALVRAVEQFFAARQ